LKKSKWQMSASARTRTSIYLVQIFLLLTLLMPVLLLQAQSPTVKHYLYVAVPGIRDYLGYGGHGILVFDMDSGHRFVKRIDTKVFILIKHLPMLKALL